MKKVLALIYTPTYGGPHNQLVRLYEPLRSRGWETVALLPNASNGEYKKIKNSGIKVITANLRRIRRFDRIKNNVLYFSNFVENINIIKDVIEEEDIDLIQVCGLMHIHAAFVKKMIDIPIVWQLLGTFAPYPLRFLYTPFISKNADWVMTTGVRTAHMHPFHQMFNHKHTPFYPPVETGKFEFSEENRRKARDWLNVSEDDYLVGTVGNKNKTKAHEEFVKIANGFKKKSNVKFRIVGHHTPSHADYYQKEVIDLAKDKKLFENGFLDIREDEIPINVLMSAFDIFLLTSRVEGMPTVILEAMSVGLPILSTSVGSIEEVIEQGVNGYVGDFGDTNYFIKKIDALLSNDSSLIQRIGSTNRLKALEELDKEICADEHAKVYQKAIRSYFARN